MAYVRAAQLRLRKPPDGEHASAASELGEEGSTALDLGPARSAVRPRPARQVRVCGDQIPEEHLLCKAELREHAVDDRRAGLARLPAAQLTLGGERDAAHARAPVSGRLADEQEPGAPTRLQVALEACPPHGRAFTDTVEVERRPDSRGGELSDERTKFLRQTRSLVRRMRKRVVVQGAVQGVFFRDTTRRLAQQHGIAGWVRNNPDGTVEAVFEGDEEAVARLVAFAREGPRGARVQRVDVYDEENEGLSSFTVQ